MAEGGEVLFRFIGDAKDLDNTISGVKSSLSDLASESINAVSKGFETLGGIITTTTAAVVGFGATYNSQIESITMSLETLTGSQEIAAEVMEQIKKDAATTPFDVQSLAKGQQMLMAQGLSAQEAESAVLALGDAISATGGTNYDFSNMLRNLTGIKALGRMTTKDMYQFQNALIPINQLLANSLGKSVEEISEMVSQGQISYEDVTKALKDAASQGGTYFGAMEKQSQTLNGIISNFQDNVGNLAGTLSIGFSEALKKVLKPLNEVIDRINDLLKKHNGFQNFTNSLITMGEKIGNFISKLTDSQLNGIIDFTLALAKSAPIMITLGAALTKIAPLFGKLTGLISGGGGILGSILELIPGLGLLISAIKGLGVTIVNFAAIFTGLTAIVGILGYINDQSNGKLLQLSKTFAQYGGDIVKKFVDNFKAKLPQIIEQGQQILENLLEGISQMLPYILDLMNKVVETIAATMKKNGRQVAKVFTDLVMGLVKILIDNLPDFIAGTYEILMGIMESIRDNAPEIIEALADCMYKMLEVALEYEDEFIDLGIELINAIGDGLIKAMPKIIESLPLFIRRMVQVFDNNAKLFWEVGKTILRVLFQGFAAQFQGFINSIGSYLDTFIYTFKRWLGLDANGGSSTFKDIGNNIITSLKNGISNAFNSIISKIRELMNSIINTISGTSLWSTGYNLIQGFINGMDNRRYAVQNMARDIANGASSALAALLRIGSPSKLFEYYGEMTVEGYNIGMNDGIDDVQRSVEAMFNVQPNVSPTMTVQQESPLATAFSNFMNNFQERPIQIEVEAEEGILVKKVTQGLREFQRANGRLPF